MGNMHQPASTFHKVSVLNGLCLQIWPLLLLMLFIEESMQAVLVYNLEVHKCNTHLAWVAKLWHLFPVYKEWHLISFQLKEYLYIAQNLITQFRAP